jgi:hypothetical protein
MIGFRILLDSASRRFLQELTVLIDGAVDVVALSKDKSSPQLDSKEDSDNNEMILDRIIIFVFIYFVSVQFIFFD